MLYEQNISDLEHLIKPQKDALKQAFASLKMKHRTGGLPFIDSIFETEICETAKAFAQSVRTKRPFKNLVLLGTGGSSLGARAAADWKAHFMRSQLDSNKPNFFVLDNFDPLTQYDIFEEIDLSSTYFLIVSKSGNTLETLSQAYFLVEHFEAKNMLDVFSDACCIITEPKDSALYRFAEKYKIQRLDHHTKIGGRYSVLTMTGLLPLFLLGYKGEELLAGAMSVANEFIQAEKFYQSAPFLSAPALAIDMKNNPQYCSHVAFMYGDRFTGLGLWMRQLIAESLGKNGHGLLFETATGPVDQHSQMQLYADGPDDKIYTFFMTGPAKRLSYITQDHDDYFSYLKGKSTSKIKDALQYGTLQSLRAGGKKIREITIPHFSHETLGALMMHAMLETVVAAEILGIDAFDQPAVEDSKIRTREILQKSSEPHMMTGS